jgi:hypothetical protein
MSAQKFSSWNFTRDVGPAKRAAVNGPVFITDRGRPAFALLKIEDYYRLAGQQEASLLDVMDAIACGPQGPGFEFEPPRLQAELRAAELG